MINFRPYNNAYCYQCWAGFLDTNLDNVLKSIAHKSDFKSTVILQHNIFLKEINDKLNSKILTVTFFKEPLSTV